MPTKSSTWLPVSAREWNVSASMAALPVIAAVAPFRRARAALPMSAATTAVFDSDAIATDYRMHHRCRRAPAGLAVAPCRLLKYDDAVQSGLFDKFWVATPTYYQERQVDPWIVAEVGGADRWAVIARWD